MGNTFYCQIKSDEKRYIVREQSFRGHSIWRSEKFWERALTAAVKSALTCQESVVWDDLDQGPLIDLVISTHNLIFGQIVSLAFTMHELGLEFEEVLYRVQDLCKKFELSEDLCAQVYQSIRTTYEISHPIKPGFETLSQTQNVKVTIAAPPESGNEALATTTDNSYKKIEQPQILSASPDAALSSFDKAMMS